jgi:type I restriction enzyme M protein
VANAIAPHQNGMVVIMMPHIRVSDRPLSAGASLDGKNAHTFEDLATLQQRTLYGWKKKALAALLGMMNLILHGVTTPNIVRANTLEESIKTGVAERFDIVPTNPPFGGKAVRHIQQNFPGSGNTTGVLFLQHIIKKLNPTANARAAVVVPKGTLFRSGAFAGVKRILLDDFHLFAVIRLPPGAFASYSDVKTVLLFFRRAEGSIVRNPLARYETWHYELPLPAGLKKFSKGSPILDKHVEEARRRWTQWKRWLEGEGKRPFLLAAEAHAADKTDNCLYWVETLDDLRARGYNLSARTPYPGERAPLPRPAGLTARLLERQRELYAAMERLHALVSNGKEEA